MKLALLWFVAKMFDATVTEIGIKKGYVELNPLVSLDNVWFIFLFNVISTFIIYFILYFLGNIKIIKEVVILCIGIIFMVALNGLVLIIVN
jgi:hypothetical protein